MNWLVETQFRGGEGRPGKQLEGEGRKHELPSLPGWGLPDCRGRLQLTSRSPRCSLSTTSAFWLRSTLELEMKHRVVPESRPYKLRSQLPRLHREWTRAGILPSSQIVLWPFPLLLAWVHHFCKNFSNQTQEKNLFKVFGAFLCVLLLENLADGRNKPAFYWLSAKSSHALLRVSGMDFRQSEVLIWFYCFWYQLECNGWLGWCGLLFL